VRRGTVCSYQGKADYAWTAVEKERGSLGWRVGARRGGRVEEKVVLLVEVGGG